MEGNRTTAAHTLGDMAPASREARCLEYAQRGEVRKLHRDQYKNTVIWPRQQALHIAAANDHADMVHALIFNHNAKVNELRNQKPPLWDAVVNGSAAAVRVLLDHKAVVRGLERFTYGRGMHDPPFAYAAAASGNCTVLGMVLTAKADVNARTLNDKHTALHAAAARGRTDMVQMLLAVRARLDLADAGWQFTPLMEAARSGHEDVMRLLVRAGASIQGGLHAAASGGHVHVARFLLGIKADVDGPGAQGQRGQALVAAINCGRNEKQHALLRLLLHAKANARGAANPQHTNPAIWAAWNGNVCALRLLLRAKADLAAETSAFAIDLPLRTPALVAAHHGFADVLRFLLKVKVDIWRENAKLLAPRLAVKCNHAYALGVLLDAKADPNFCWEGPDFTLAMCVVGIANSTRAQGLKWQGRADVLRVLVQAKADLERYNPAFGTVACRAAAGGCVDVLQVLVDARCNLETRTVQGDTPLCLATSARQEAAVRVLIHAKADVNAADAQGRPAWELAAEWRSGELVTLMLSAKADIDARAGARAELAKWYTA